MRAALIDLSTHLVDNLIEADADYEAPEGFLVVFSDTAHQGDSYDGAAFEHPPEPAPTADQLARYADLKQAAVMEGGIEVAVSAGTADVATDERGRGFVNAKVTFYQLVTASGQTPPPSSWVNDDGSTIAITMADTITIGLAVGNHVQRSWDVLGEAHAAIAAGSITTMAAIDALAWPPNA